MRWWMNLKSLVSCPLFYACVGFRVKAYEDSFPFQHSCISSRYPFEKYWVFFIWPWCFEGKYYTTCLEKIGGCGCTNNLGYASSKAHLLWSTWEGWHWRACRWQNCPVPSQCIPVTAGKVVVLVHTASPGWGMKRGRRLRATLLCSMLVKQW